MAGAVEEVCAPMRLGGCRRFGGRLFGGNYRRWDHGAFSGRDPQIRIKLFMLDRLPRITANGWRGLRLLRLV